VRVGYAALIMPASDGTLDEATADELLHRIESVTDVALAHLSVEDLLVQLLERVQRLLGADTAAVLLLDPSGEYLVATAAKGIEAEVRQGVRIPLGKGFAGRIAADKRPVILEHVDHTNVLNPILRESGIRSLLGVPLLSSGDVIGVLHIGTLTPRQFTEDEVRLLQIVADRVGFGVQSRRVEIERAAATVLQRSLLPARLPVVPGLEMTARYVSAEHGGVGGDWYDVFLLPDDRLCVVIGDVVGRGLAAAEVMGRLRTALRAHALFSNHPGEVLDRLDRQVQHFHPHKMLATVQLAMFEPSLERMQLSSAGHLPPVLAVPGQPAALVNVRGDYPVGVPTRQRRRVTTVEVPPGAVVCFYTDGLVERRGVLLDVGLDRLCKAVAVGPVDSVLTTVMGQLIGDDPPGDDVAVLAVRRHHDSEIGAPDQILSTANWTAT
jgi:putative methionine-R-sulfoxide reductase with GAF domain